MLSRGEIDIAPADLTITKARSTVADFLPGMTSSYQQLFLKNPAEAPNWKAYVEPFTYNSWLVIFLFIVVVPLIVSAIILYGNGLLTRFYVKSSYFYYNFKPNYFTGVNR